MQRVLVEFAKYRPTRYRQSLRLLRALQFAKVIVHPFKRSIKPLSKVLLFSAPLVLLTKQTLLATEGPAMEDTLKQVDDLYLQNKMKEAYDLLVPHQNVENVDVQWKFARLCYRMGKMEGSANAKKFADDAMQHIDRAVAIDSECFNAQKWRGIILSWFCDFEGYKKKIERTYEIKENFDKACKLNPNDPTARHLLGRWFYDVADVPWYMKSAAKYILAELPSATYENALEVFLEAEKIEEGFFSQNWLYIGKCYYSLKKKDEAKVWLKKAAQVQGDNQDDSEARRLAEELLKKI